MTLSYFQITSWVAPLILIAVLLSALLPTPREVCPHIDKT